MSAGRATLLIALAVAGCASHRGPDAQRAPALEGRARGIGASAPAAHPVPDPVVVPDGFRRAILAGTRTDVGEAGGRYWQQWVDYDIYARVDEVAKALTGSERITYHNRSPQALPGLVVNVLQDFHAAGAVRLRPAEVTGGMAIGRVSFEGQDLEESSTGAGPGWFVDGTLLYIRLPKPIASHSSGELTLEWTFPIPARGAGGRMGYTDDDFFHVAYWYPQMAVFDDVAGWHTDPFRGNAEFYSDFGTYKLTIDAPKGWLVMSTGTLENPYEVLAPDVAARLRQAESSDDVIHIVTHDRARSATADAPSGRLQWVFAADSVRDVAFALMRDHAWDAARADVGDRDGDGQPEYARADAFWRASQTRYANAWRYAQHSVEFLSRHTGLSYPWPHMSVIEGAGIIGGGMEFPMMTLIGSYEARSDTALYGVVSHEIGHMWFPMTLSSNERRYAWMDEGTTEFNDNGALGAFFPGTDSYAGNRASYLAAVKGGWDGPIMRWSDFHRDSREYTLATYDKPAEGLRILRGLLGQATFTEAYHAFYDRWAFKHPYPWDLFHTFEDVSGWDLDWFWRAWYYESTQDGDWYLDRAVADVERLPGGSTRITVVNEGWVPLPVPLRITRTDGEVIERVIPVDRWLGGADRVTVTVPAGSPVLEVALDPDGLYPELDRTNDTWRR